MAQGLAELRDVLRQTLDNRGVLGEIKARVRAEVFNALDEDEAEDRPRLSNENMIINELIREYLEYNGYRHTLSVLVPETGQPEDASKHLPRSLMVSEFGLREDGTSEQLPLLYGIVAKLQADASAATARASIARTPKGVHIQVDAGNGSSGDSSKKSPMNMRRSPQGASVSHAPIPGNSSSLSSNDVMPQPRPFEFSGGNN